MENKASEQIDASQHLEAERYNALEQKTTIDLEALQKDAMFADIPNKLFRKVFGCSKRWLLTTIESILKNRKI